MSLGIFRSIDVYMSKNASIDELPRKYPDEVLPRPASELEKSEICCGSASEYTAIAFTFFGHLPAKAIEQLDLDFYREESRSTKRNEHGKERESSKRKRRMSSDIDKRE
ncbi:hypothetical protein DY000_02033575 [Brassica cretica]|uniref:Uncharacterized protein n=1 Tax=Brassica cretica TaxID=69181 RepID=A0ABQ7DI43_BRACR|nr:hypothetical protein DY000_02033575 [Brassica cretica]